MGEGDDLTSVLVALPVRAASGAELWLPLVDGRPGRRLPGLGYGGQFILVDPELDLVVVATTEWRGTEDDEADAIGGSRPGRDRGRHPPCHPSGLRVPLTIRAPSRSRTEVTRGSNRPAVAP